MQLYFLKASYTNNMYKISDFYLTGSYKLVAGKMLDINFRPNDGLSSFITKELTLPDATSIREQTHIIVPDFNKIYKIIAIDYVNAQQIQVTVEDDPFIGSYTDFEDEDIIVNRTNHQDLFRGVNDISDVTLKKTIETKVISSESRTGKWALVFMQIDADLAGTIGARYGMRFQNFNAPTAYEQSDTLTTLLATYPEVTTDTPNLYSYYQKIVYVVADLKAYQCVNRKITGTSINELYWEVYRNLGVTERWFELQQAVGGRTVQSDIRNIMIAMPFESNIKGPSSGTTHLLTYQQFLGPIDGAQVIDIKIVDDILMKIDDVLYFGPSSRAMQKEVSADNGEFILIDSYVNGTTPTKCTTCAFMSVILLETDIPLDPNYITTDPKPLESEPFITYDLSVFGSVFNIPYYLTDDLHLLIAMNSGVINYTVYYGDKRYVVGAGSFTHSLRYVVDKLDSFYNQNPTYKEQFFVKMGTDSIKTVAGGAIGGSAIPGVGTLVGAGLGVAGAGVDAGLSLINLHYQEKSMKLQPDQIFGEVAEVAMQLLNIFGIYFVKRTSENADLMAVEYALRGFPTEVVTDIGTLEYWPSEFGLTKLVFGEIKTVIKNEYTTGYINMKLQQGVIFILW